MWNLIKKISSYIYRISLAIFFLWFTVMLFLLLFNQELLTDSKIINFVAIIMAFLSLPGLIDQIARDVNPKPKMFKVRTQCPKCRHSIIVDMTETKD